MITRTVFLKGLLALPFTQFRKQVVKKLMLEREDFESFDYLKNSVNLLDSRNTYNLHYIDGIETKIVSVKLKEAKFQNWESFRHHHLQFESTTGVMFLFSGDGKKISISVYVPSRIMLVEEKFYQFVGLEVILRDKEF